MNNFNAQSWDKWSQSAFNVPSIQNPNPVQPTVGSSSVAKSWKDYAQDSLTQSSDAQKQQYESAGSEIPDLSSDSIPFNDVQPLNLSSLQPGASPVQKPIDVANNINSGSFNNRFRRS